MKRIAITGPESTGKSWLAANLAKAFNADWVPEFSRNYLNNLNREYTFEDILAIAKGQFAAEEKAAKKSKEWLFCDTDFLVTRIWCMVKYGKSHPWIDQMFEQQRYQHYLLCNTDLPWEADPLREHPHFRDELLGMYKAELERNHLPYTLISGKGEQRLQHAIRAIDPGSFANPCTEIS